MDLSSLSPGKKTALMGVGNPELGDDAAGVYIAESLIYSGFTNVFNCLAVPENYLGKVSGLSPERIIIADAVDMGRSAGYTALLDPGEVHQGITTHNSGLDMIAEFFSLSGGSEILILAIQPGSLKGAISEEVKKAADRAVELLKEVI